MCLQSVQRLRWNISVVLYLRVCGWVILPAVAADLTVLLRSDHCWSNTTVSTVTLVCVWVCVWVWVCVSVPISQVMPRLAPGWQVELMLPGWSSSVNTLPRICRFCWVPCVLVSVQQNLEQLRLLQSLIICCIQGNDSPKKLNVERDTELYLMIIITLFI